MNQAVPTHIQTWVVTTSRGVIFQHPFTGKERDEETGYGYFGARYYDADLLTGWLSVDPMSDKYPSISPYNYCAWNPVKLVDPDGKEVEYSSLTDRFLVCIERVFNKGFRIRFQDLETSQETYVFNYNNDGINKLSTDGDKLMINYSLNDLNKKEGSTRLSLLKHETEHAVQFEYGELGFVKVDDCWKPINFDINDELKARDFEASGAIKRNAQSIQSRWGFCTEPDLKSREGQVQYLRECGYTCPDAIFNNRDGIDVGKDDTKFALKHREREVRL